MFAVSASLEASSYLLSKYSSETLGYVTPHKLQNAFKCCKKGEIAEKV